MNKRRQDDPADEFDDELDDDFDDDAFLDDEELQPGSGRPKRPRDPSSDKPSRRRELASLKAWGTPY